MTMAMTFRHLPPEIESARQTLVAACAEAMPTRDARSKRVLMYFCTLAVGSTMALVLVSLGVVSPTDHDFWRGGLSAISVLSGFMVATMVFTGKIEAAKNLTLSELRDVTAKANHLLLYQIGTLANHLLCLSLMLLVPSLCARWPTIGPSFAVLSLAVFFASIARSLLVPLQIIELHRFTHAALLREKREDAARNAGEM